MYNASNNELVRTKTLVKNCIVLIDSTPYRQWYEAHYALPLGRKKGAKLVRLGFSFGLLAQHSALPEALTHPEQTLPARVGLGTQQCLSELCSHRLVPRISLALLMECSVARVLPEALHPFVHKDLPVKIFVF